MAFYQGNDGSLQLDGTPLGDLVEWSLKVSGREVDRSTLAPGGTRKARGRIGYSGSLTVRWRDQVGDTSEAGGIVSQLVSTSDVASSTVTATFEWGQAGNVRLITIPVVLLDTELNATADGGTFESSFDFQGDGLPSVVTIA